MKKTIILILTIIAMEATAQTQKMSGRWFSTEIENLGNGWGTRDFSFEENKWKLTFTMYGDSLKLYPLFAFDTEGTFSVGNKSKVKEAFETEFIFTKKHLTALTDDVATLQQLGFTNCNLKKGIKTDITENGCSFFASVKNYGKEFDLTSLQKEKLFLGSRPADNNLGTAEKRPIALGYPLEKFNAEKHLK